MRFDVIAYALWANEVMSHSRTYALRYGIGGTLYLVVDYPHDVEYAAWATCTMLKNITTRRVARWDENRLVYGSQQISIQALWRVGPNYYHGADMVFYVGGCDKRPPEWLLSADGLPVESAGTRHECDSCLLRVRCRLDNRYPVFSHRFFHVYAPRAASEQPSSATNEFVALGNCLKPEVALHKIKSTEPFLENVRRCHTQELAWRCAR